MKVAILTSTLLNNIDKNVVELNATFKTWSKAHEKVHEVIDKRLDSNSGDLKKINIKLWGTISGVGLLVCTLLLLYRFEIIHFGLHTPK